MIILHGGICDGRLLVWGESPPQSGESPRKRPGRKPKISAPEPLPYDPGLSGLMSALEEAGIGLTVPARAAGAKAPRGAKGKKTDGDSSSGTVIWLPTAGGVPPASSPMIAEPAQTVQNAVLTPWIVTVLPLSAEQAVDFLCACSDKRMLAPGVIVGKDLSFLTLVMRFAGALVVRQEFLPSVSQSGTHWIAKWEPFFSGPESNRLSMLSKAMPDGCRAFSPIEASSPPELDPKAELVSFIGNLVDTLVRSSSSQPMELPKSKRKAGAKALSFDSIHDQWMHALQSSDGLMESGDPGEPARFAAQVREWHHPVSVAAATAFRLCFRLEEPRGGDTGDDDDDAALDHKAGGEKVNHGDSDTWKVRYLLQATDDPSLLVPAEQAWRDRGGKGSVLRRGGLNPRAYLLSALGHAASLCPQVEASLKKALPSGYDMDSTGAYDFLIQKAWALEQAGFGVLLPGWWTRKGTKLKVTTRAHVKSPKMQGGGKLSLEEIVHFNWEVALGGDALSFQELQALAALKAPLVKVRGQWVQVNAEEIQAALEFWKKHPDGEATAREIARMALGGSKTFAGIPLETVTATGWIDDLLARLEGRAAFEELDQPAGFHGTLRPYQRRGYSWMGFLRQWGLGACLADDMGLGKTVQTLALIQKDREMKGKKPVLLVCPMSVVNNWQKEAARFTPDLKVMIHHGAGRMKGRAFKTEAKKHAIVISSYALLHRDFEILEGVPWSGIILDEAQNIKNPETKQARAARAIPGEYRLALTGTPVENNVGDLWSIMEFLNPGFLETQAEFKRRFFLPIQANRDAEAAERLKKLTGPFILRRLKTDKSIISDLPEKMEMKVFCSLTREQASLYEAVTRDAAEALDAVDGIQRKGVVLATLSKLKQVCNHPAQFLGDNSPIPGRSGKLVRLTEMCEEIVQVGDRALVFTQFSEMGGIMQRYLQETFGQEVLFLHGGVSKKQRDRMVERFQAEGPGPRLFILSLKAGGTGLNLTNANHVFHFDRWWNPAVENQATDRAFRIGQTRNVQVHKFVCAGTLEERIDEMIESKKEVAEGIVGTGEGWLTELSTGELKQLFALREDAVAE